MSKLNYTRLYNFLCQYLTILFLMTYLALFSLYFSISGQSIQKTHLRSQPFKESTQTVELLPEHFFKISYKYWSVSWIHVSLVLYVWWCMFPLCGCLWWFFGHTILCYTSQKGWGFQNVLWNSAQTANYWKGNYLILLQHTSLYWEAAYYQNYFINYTLVLQWIVIPHYRGRRLIVQPGKKVQFGLKYNGRAKYTTNV